jgi:hypothetical protein
VKPHYKLHLNGQISLASVPSDYASFNTHNKLGRQELVAAIKKKFGSVSAWQREFGIPHTLVQDALTPRGKYGCIGGGSGALRALMGLPVRSSANTKALDITLKVPLQALALTAKRRGR